MQPKLPFIDTISHKLAELLKNSPAKDLEANLKAGLTSMLGKLDLVSREEFDVQAEVLQRTKAQLQVLEARLGELETQSKSRHSQD
ncbi:MAG: accessory factor UbiK family protein [Thiobacillaceae bacterium]|jgi:BMFP domain-containing protein YqiC